MKGRQWREKQTRRKEREQKIAKDEKERKRTKNCKRREGKKENFFLQKTRKKEREEKKTLQSTGKGRQQQGEGKVHGKNTAEYVEKKKNTKERGDQMHHSRQLRG
jgi:hypothetical protein